MSRCGYGCLTSYHTGCRYGTQRAVEERSSLYISTDDEHARKLADAAIRALEQLSLTAYVRDPNNQVIEQELAFMELTMRRIRRELP